MKIEEVLEHGEHIVSLAAISGTTIVATSFDRILAQDWVFPGVWVPYEGVGADHQLIRDGKNATREHMDAAIKRCQ